MQTLTCPYCGVAAEETELSPGGEAHLTRHGPGSSDADFEGYLFARQNPRGVLFDRWRHAYGCGKWFLAARDSVTLEVFGTYPAQSKAPPPELVARIRAALPPNVQVAGSSYTGVGIPDCVNAGRTAARDVVAALGVDR